MKTASRILIFGNNAILDMVHSRPAGPDLDAVLGATKDRSAVFFTIPRAERTGAAA